MSTSLTTKTTLGLMPLAIGILLRHYYDRVLKDKNKSKNGEGAAVLVPLRQEELMYDEAFTITRVSLSLLNPQINPNHPDTISGYARQNFMDSATKCVPTFNTFFSVSLKPNCDGSHTVEELQQFT